MNIEFKARVIKWIKKNPDLARDFIDNHLPKIQAAPYKASHKLKTKLNLYSYHFHRKPEYRAIYSIENGKIIFYLIASREEVYKDLKNVL